MYTSLNKSGRGYHSFALSSSLMRRPNKRMPPPPPPPPLAQTNSKSVQFPFATAVAWGGPYGAPNQSIFPAFFHGLFDFLYAQLTFYMLNSTFYMANKTFYMAN